MRLSTKGDYGVRALIDLALYGGEGPVQRAEIAARQEIPESYLDHLLAQLRRDGFIRSTRGPGGGHQLTRDPADICLLHVIESLEGSIAPLQCLQDESMEAESGDEAGATCSCPQHWVWRDIYRETRRRLGAVSLAELAQRQRDRLQLAAANYSI